MVSFILNEHGQPCALGVRRGRRYNAAINSAPVTLGLTSRKKKKKSVARNAVDFLQSPAAPAGPRGNRSPELARARTRVHIYIYIYVYMYIYIHICVCVCVCVCV